MNYPINQSTLNTSVLATLYSKSFYLANTEYVDVVVVFTTEKVYLYSNVPLDNIYKYKTTLEQEPDASSGKLFNLLIKNAQGVVYTPLGDFSEVINVE
jgi:hypothetical protein